MTQVNGNVKVFRPDSAEEIPADSRKKFQKALFSEIMNGTNEDAIGVFKTCEALPSIPSCGDYHGGFSTRMQIADYLGVAEPSVRNMFNKYGITRNKTNDVRMLSLQAVASAHGSKIHRVRRPDSQGCEPWYMVDGQLGRQLRTPMRLTFSVYSPRAILACVTAITDRACANNTAVVQALKDAVYKSDYAQAAALRSGLYQSESASPAAPRPASITVPGGQDASKVVDLVTDGGEKITLPVFIIQTIVETAVHAAIRGFAPQQN